MVDILTNRKIPQALERCFFRLCEIKRKSKITKNLSVQVLVNRELALKRTKTSVGFLEGKKQSLWVFTATNPVLNFLLGSDPGKK